MTIFLLYWFLALICWAYACIRGGAPARWCFALFVACSIGTILATPLGTGMKHWTGPNVPLFIADAAFLVGIYAVMLRYRRYWLIWFSGLQLMCVLTHLGPLIDSGFDPKLYRGLESVWMLPMLLAMVLGIARDRRAARLSGTAAR